MVAISVYKGKLHRAPNTHREWLMPTPKISLKDFKTLLNRRARALQSTSNPNPNTQSPNSKPVENGSTPHHHDWSLIPTDAVLPEIDSNTAPLHQEDQLLAPPKEDSLNGKEERKKEVEDKLKILNERKHKLVQVLKQILNAEEELRRRSNVQGITGRPSVSLQVDVTNDSGSMSRHVTPRPASEGADVGGADADNMHPRNMTRMSSMSPSSDSLPRRAPFSMVPNSSRGIVASSPSRFAPGSNGQPQSSNLPSVSVTGTNYVASSPSLSPSPSPAGSGGTSVFRDAIASPWN
ncbi:hypothetical protein HanXRQr2_Chr02g0063061 [Helianthus annuus]|uniref:Uncharacterized protein n=1 Tax=Helianthus annuus TaxID=4232 RepID=A0A251VFJ1_HELAN|nr:uncharacterized protein LOC110919509 isoform X1 [Helianthus annuus]KAF5818268.1 hypothetical protein HanXRQr2_Chr02g0063061 [Helianthus annuus]KAJ0604595.1 hypothetical protein HanHA300_Chr02g0051871 [Helianthus annuus]